jgi:hypothetical protein
MPTTTPAAIPAVLGLLGSSFCGAFDGVEDGVTAATAEVAAADEGFADDDELETGS